MQSQPDAESQDRSSRASRGGLWAVFGAMGAAVVASACCWLPLLLVAVGASGIAATKFFEQYRILFMVLTFLFLGAAFYLAYRPRRATSAAVSARGEAGCDTGAQSAEACCPPAGAGVRKVYRASRVGLWAVTGLVLTFAFFPTYSGWLLGTGAGMATTSADRETILLDVQGMTCGGCEASVCSAVDSVSGVAQCRADSETGRATIELAQHKPAPRDALVAAVERAGFEASVVKTAEKRMAIEGMTCSACAAPIQNGLSGLAGVQSASVSYTKKKARVVVGPDGPSDQKLRQAVKSAGYTATSVQTLPERE